MKCSAECLACSMLHYNSKIFLKSVEPSFEYCNIILVIGRKRQINIRGFYRSLSMNWMPPYAAKLVLIFTKTGLIFTKTL